MRECLCGRAQLNFVYSTCHGDQASSLAHSWEIQPHAMERETEREREKDPLFLAPK